MSFVTRYLEPALVERLNHLQVSARSVVEGSMTYGGATRGPLGPGAGVAPGSKFDYGAKLVASLAYLMLGQTETVGLALFGERVRQWLAPRSGTSQLSRVIDLLERAAPTGT